MKKNNLIFIERYAAKKVNDEKDSIHEANLIKNLSHKNIVKYYDNFSNGLVHWLILEYCDVIIYLNTDLRT